MASMMLSNERWRWCWRGLDPLVCSGPVLDKVPLSQPLISIPLYNRFYKNPKTKNQKHEILFFPMTSPQAKLTLFNLARERSCIILSSLHKSFDTTTMVSLRLWMPWKSWFSVLMFILLYFYRSGKHKHDKRLFSREGVAQCVFWNVNHNVANNPTFADSTSCLLLSGTL